MTIISRDPFARADLVRTPIFFQGEKECCGWCGRAGKEMRRGKRRLFVYGIEMDRMNKAFDKDFHKHGFCDITCFRSYMGV